MMNESMFSDPHAKKSVAEGEILSKIRENLEGNPLLPVINQADNWVDRFALLCASPCKIEDLHTIYNDLVDNKLIGLNEPIKYKKKVPLYIFVSRRPSEELFALANNMGQDHEFGENLENVLAELDRYGIRKDDLTFEQMTQYSRILEVNWDEIADRRGHLAACKRMQELVFLDDKSFAAMQWVTYDDVLAYFESSTYMPQTDEDFMKWRKEWEDILIHIYRKEGLPNIEKWRWAAVDHHNELHDFQESLKTSEGMLAAVKDLNQANLTKLEVAALADVVRNPLFWSVNTENFAVYKKSIEFCFLAEREPELTSEEDIVLYLNSRSTVTDLRERTEYLLDRVNCMGYAALTTFYQNTDFSFVLGLCNLEKYQHGADIGSSLRELWLAILNKDIMRRLTYYQMLMGVLSAFWVAFWLANSELMLFTLYPLAFCMHEYSVSSECIEENENKIPFSNEKNCLSRETPGVKPSA